MKKTVQTSFLMLAALLVFSALGIQSAEASAGGLDGVAITDYNEITATFEHPLATYDASIFSNLGLGLVGRNITGITATTSNSISVSFDGPPVAPNTTGSVDVGPVSWSDGPGGFSGAAGYPVDDGIPPHLGVVTLQDNDNSGTLTPGDTLSFRFNEPMTENVTADNIDEYLGLSNGHTFGTATSGLAISWNTSSTTLTVTVPTDSTIAPGDTVRMSDSIYDISGNQDFQPDSVGIPATTTVPRTLYFNGAADGDWFNVNNWWNDAGYTEQALSIPDEYDDAVVEAPVNPDLADEIYVHSLTLAPHMISNNNLDYFFMNINAPAGVTVDSGWNLLGSVMASTTYNDYAAAGFPYNYGYFFGLANIVGDAHFNASTTANYGTIIGNTTFNGEYGNAGLIYGNTAFDDDTSNPGMVIGNATFRGNSANGGFVQGNADVYSPAENPLSGVVEGAIEYHGYEFDGGSGTPDDPYQISSCQELQNMNNHLSASYELTQDVDCSASSGWNANPDEWVDGEVGGTLIPDSYASTTHTDIIVANNGYSGFMPVGNQDSPFTGTFDGNGYTVSNLWIFRKSSPDIGLFGSVSGAVIMNLGLADSSIVGGNNTGGVTGLMADGTLSGIYLENNMVRAYLTTDGGGLVGSVTSGNIATVENAGGNVHGSGNVIGGIIGYMATGTVSYASSSAAVDGGLDIGGVIGHMDGGTVTNSNSTGAVTCNRSEYIVMKLGFYAGGFVGYMGGGTIDRSYASGNVTSSGQYAGGFVGFANAGSVISNSHAAGDVTGVTETAGDTTYTPTYIGGFVGAAYQASFTETDAAGNIVAPGDYAGGFAADLSGSTVHDAYESGSVAGHAYVGGFAGYAENEGEILRAYARGAVSGTDAGTNAGFIGSTDSSVNVSNSFWNTEAAGQPTHGDPSEKTTAEMTASSTYMNAGWDFSAIWGQEAELNGGYPYFLSGSVPIVSAVTPADGSTNVSLMSPIVMQFSEPMNTESVVISTTTCGHACGSYSQTWTGGDRTLTLMKTDGFYAHDVSYTVSVLSAQSADGVSMAAPYTWSFTTVPSSDATEARFVSPTPADGSAQDADSIDVRLQTQDSQSGHYALADFDGDLAGWWRFENNANDELGRSNGTWNGAEAYEDGQFGRTGSFDGSTSYVSADLQSPVTSSFTVSAWTRLNSLSDGASLVSDQLGQLLQIGGSNRWQFDNVYSADAVATTGAWTHVVGVYDAPSHTESLYVNGVLVNSITSDRSVSQVINIGRREDGQYINGDIDEVTFWRKALDAGEVASLYDATSHEYDHTFTGLDYSTHKFTGYAVDTAGTKVSTGERSVIRGTLPVTQSAGPAPTGGQKVAVSTAVYGCADPGALNYSKFVSGVSSMCTYSGSGGKAIQPAGQPAKATPLLSAALPSPFKRNLSIGMNGSDVRQLQSFLNAHGFTVSLSGAGSPGKENTSFGSKTRLALSRYQKASGIASTGFFGPVTMAFVNKQASNAGKAHDVTVKAGGKS